MFEMNGKTKTILTLKMAKTPLVFPAQTIDLNGNKALT
jgi:hypothetical protein